MSMSARLEADRPSAHGGEAMSITNPSKPVAQRSSARTLGPQLLFGTTVFATFAVLTGAVSALPSGLFAPVASTLVLVMAAAAALIGWLRDRGPDPPRVTYWDVAGALTLVGIGAAALVEPDQLLRIFDAPPSEK
jgi:hypothetical protein